MAEESTELTSALAGVQVTDWKAAKEAAPACHSLADCGDASDAQEAEGGDVPSWRTPEAVAAVSARFLDRKTPLVERFRCVFTLRNIATPAAIDALTAGFVDEPSDLLKHEIAYVLGQIRDPRAVPVLLELLANEKECAMVRHEAGEALGAIGDESAMESLEKYAQDPVVEVAETCQVAIDLIRWRREQEAKEGEKLSANPYHSVDPAPPCPEHDVPKLRALLLDTSKPLFKRYRAMFSLRNIGSDDAAIAIADSLTDSSALFRHEAAYVLGQMQNQAVVDHLIAVVDRDDEEPMVRHEAAESLGAIGTTKAMDRLQSLQHDRHQVVHESCVVALDIMDYYASGDFQYADSLQKV
eukprot:CAMPEP_0177650110 /NCGR_PEP_ID=MMETSP0447-20121125/11754_1 /TAXON_ID=0 /ORGANISM="Stygamoeba regulata, Strain BSH-02190019" /LENGTH=354 /DNA_ID=CAMNT_0019152931 /DNA_START=29 /DNA_END=1093 /DNA_ORIENTATION=+